MRSTVVYYSQTGSTKKVAEAIYSGIKSATGQCEIATVRDVAPESMADYDLIALGCPVFEFKAPANFRTFEENLPMLNGKHCFLFATHGSDRGMIFRDMGEVLLKKGLTVIGYRTWYGEVFLPSIPKPYFTEGHPDSVDLNEAADFGREMAELSLRIHRGENGPVPDVMSLKERPFPPQPPIELKHNQEKCRYPICHLCVDNCPIEGCIDLRQDPVVFAHKEKCIRCWMCCRVCPSEAVECNWESLTQYFREVEQPGMLQAFEKAERKGYFRRLVKEVDLNTPWYKSCDTPAIRIEDAPCTLACPIHMDVPGYMDLAGQGRFEEAYRLMRRTNPLPAVCGRVCHHPCEDDCQRLNVDESLAIASVKRLVTDQADIENIEIAPVGNNEKKVAVVGAGPCGLSAAHDLALLGYKVTIFEALPELGGMMRVGIPEYQLPGDVLQRDIDGVLKTGVQVKLGIRLGSDLSLGELRQQGFEAVLLATGAHLPRPLNVGGVNLSGVSQGVHLLRDMALGKTPDDLFENKKVVVIGGGNVAIGAARTALRLGAMETQIFYRRTKDRMPTHDWEVQHAEEEGVTIVFGWEPERILGRDNEVTGVEFKSFVSVSDEKGAFGPGYDHSAMMIVEADAVIVAIGQIPDTSYLSAENGVKIAEDATAQVDEVTLETNCKGVFAGGELVSGASNVADAIAAGKRAARSIDNFLSGIPLDIGQTGDTGSRYELDDYEIALLQKKVPMQSRIDPRELAPTERLKSFVEVNAGYELPQGQRESQRCLKCDWKA